MICPICGYENLQGVDECGNCGSDLRTADTPQPGTGFERLLVERPLAALNAPTPLSLPPDTSVSEAVGQLRAEGASCVLVEADGRLAGIVTERDLLLRAAGKPLDGLRLEQLMTADPVVLRPDDSIAVAIHKMAVGGFRHIPIVENGHATGIVSAGDLFRYLLEVID